MHPFAGGRDENSGSGFGGNGSRCASSGGRSRIQKPPAGTDQSTERSTASISMTPACWARTCTATSAEQSLLLPARASVPNARRARCGPPRPSQSRLMATPPRFQTRKAISMGSNAAASRCPDTAASWGVRRCPPARVQLAEKCRYDTCASSMVRIPHSRERRY